MEASYAVLLGRIAGSHEHRRVSEETKRIAVDVLLGTGHAETKYGKIMRYIWETLPEDHQRGLVNLVKQAAPNVNNVRNGFAEVLDETFADGYFNWGRIVILFAFAARLADACYGEHRAGNGREEFSEFVGQCIASKCGQWILDNGGWDAYAELHEVPGSSENTWKNALHMGVRGLILAFKSFQSI